MKYRLKLVKALSYSGIISATRENPVVIVEDETVANEAVATGYFELIKDKEDDVPPILPDDETSDFDFDEISSMSISKLKNFAEEHDIDISGKTKKADILEVISVALGGSYTMLDLQEK